MSDNVGLATPRGSGTSGYVQRNLAHMRPRDYGAPYSRDIDSLRHKQRKPDPEILEHDRKREIEVKVFELRDELEEEGWVSLYAGAMPPTCCNVLSRRQRRKQTASKVGPLLTVYSLEEDAIEARCDDLRNKLLGELKANKDAGSRSKKSFKGHQIHEMADEKIKESERLRRALKISDNYQEGSHWKRQDEKTQREA